MSFLNAINNSVKSFSKSCFETMKSNPSKYRGPMLRMGINRMSNLSGEVRRFFANEMEECLKDKEGYFIKLKSVAREGVENTYSQIVRGQNYDTHELGKEQKADGKGSLKKEDYDIGE